MRARYYKPDIKRFISLDTLHGDILNPQALNRYAYVLGNPVMGVDPSGKNTLSRERAELRAALLVVRLADEGFVVMARTYRGVDYYQWLKRNNAEDELATYADNLRKSDNKYARLGGVTLDLFEATGHIFTKNSSNPVCDGGVFSFGKNPYEVAYNNRHKEAVSSLSLSPKAFLYYELCVVPQFNNTGGAVRG